MNTAQIDAAVIERCELAMPTAVYMQLLWVRACAVEGLPVLPSAAMEADENYLLVKDLGFWPYEAEESDACDLHGYVFHDGCEECHRKTRQGAPSAYDVINEPQFLIGEGVCPQCGLPYRRCDLTDCLDNVPF